MISRDPVDFSEHFPQNRNCPTLRQPDMEINWDFLLEIIGHHPQPSFRSKLWYKTSHTFDGMGSEHIGTSTIYCIYIQLYTTDKLGQEWMKV